MRSSILVAVAAVLAFALSACFNPTFNNPACGPQGECPADHTCVQGVCRAQAEPIDAADNDGVAPTDGTPGDGAPGDGPPGDGPGCLMRLCDGNLFQCGDCIDNDADGLTDAHDPDCLGVCDNTEGSILLMGFPGEVAQCPLDSYWDGNTGPGDDGCRWDLRCYTQGGFPMCPHDPLLVGSTSCPNNQSSSCVNTQGLLIPNGCDCFGCCATPDGSRSVFIGARDASGSGTCTRATMNDPQACPNCTPQPSCFNSCDSCEVCVGRQLPAACGGAQMCPSGRNRCGQPGQAECPSSEYCVTGCCQPSPT